MAACAPSRTLLAALTVACARPAATADDPFSAARARMVSETIAPRGVKDARVLAAMRKVPRHEFLPPSARVRAYDDTPVPIGHGQTASQPYMVAVMTELAELGPKSRVLEIGTGSGYQAAVLAEVAGDVYSIELLEPLATSARRTLDRLGYGRVHVRQGDGYRGWPEAAPFDAIVVTAAPPEVPDELRRQLAPRGRLVIPIGRDDQELEVHTRTPDGYQVRRFFPVTFVPMVPGGTESRPQ
jgi:protein-L-isoaspartate(D-aspartate) O-methyltransferase